MRIFKTWYEGNVFCKEKAVEFSNCDMLERMSLGEVMKTLTEAGGEDYTEKGMSHAFLVEHGYVFLLSRVTVRFHKIPKAEDIITLKTWEGRVKGPQVFRDFEIFSEQGQKIISAETGWLIVEPKTHKIIRPGNFTLRKFPESKTKVDSMECVKIPIPESLVELGHRKIVFSDLDGNGHVNNSKYASIAIDHLPQDIQNVDIKDFCINFISEVKLGDILHMYGARNEETEMFTIVGKQKERICFSCEFYF